MICMIVLMIVEAIVISVAVSSCKDGKTSFIDCSFEPWDVVYPRLIAISIFCAVAAFISCTLAVLFKEKYRDRHYDGEQCC